jgi:nicotinic acid mononucleotide adenylyltransferase
MESSVYLDPCQKLNHTLKSEIGFRFSRKNLTPLPTSLRDKIEECKSEGRKPLILLNTGAYCPPHFGHFGSLIHAKDFLEKHFNYKVLAIYTSPAQDFYVKYKSQRYGFEKFKLNLNERIDMLEWTKTYFADKCEILVDKWEGNQPLFIHFPNVWISLQYFLEKTLEEQGIQSELKVGYCLGDDLLKTQIDLTYKFLRLERMTYELPLIIYGREGDHSTSVADRIQKYQGMSLNEMVENNLYYVPESKKENIVSSSLIRKFFEKSVHHHELKNYIHPKVLGYIRGKLLAHTTRNSTDISFPQLASLTLDCN